MKTHNTISKMNLKTVIVFIQNGKLGFRIDHQISEQESLKLSNKRLFK